jgi:hypothetical protein
MAGFDWSPYATSGALRGDSFSGMQPQFSSALANLFASAPDDIRSQLQVKSGYRSPERQAELYQQALRKYGSPEAARKWVAPPGNSQHNHGNAADLGYLSPDALNWARANAGKFGLSFPLSNENWHIELAGARGGHAPAAGSAPTMASVQAKTFDPVGDVMAAGQGGTPGGVASMFAGPVTPGGISAPYAPMGAQPVLGNLALMFAQQQAERQRQREDEQQAEQTRKAALFSGDSLAGLYG